MNNNKIIKTTTVAAVMATLAGTAFAAGVAPSAFAAATPDSNNANDIVINASGSTNHASVKGHTFEAYRLATYQNVQFAGQGDTRHATGYDMQQTNAEVNAATLKAIQTAVTNSTVKTDKTLTTPTQVNTEWGALVKINGQSISFIGDAANLSPIQFVGKYFYGTGTDVYGNATANKAEMRTFANTLYTLGALKTPDATVQNADTTARFDFGPDDGGLYLIIDKGKGGTGDKDGKTISRAMITGTAFKDGNSYVNTLWNDEQGTVKYTLGQLNLKADEVTVTKEVVGHDKLVGVNSVRTFQIYTNVPNYANNYQHWKNPKFAIHDNPSDNIQVSENGNFTDIAHLKLEADTGADGAYVAIDNTKYTVTADADHAGDKNAFKVSLKNPADYSGHKIRLTYDAKILNVNVSVTENDTNIEFSNNPYDENSVDKTPADKEKLYQADLQLEKVKFNDANTTLDGATFTVTTADGKGTPVKFTNNGQNYVLDANGANASNVITLNSTHGATTLKGLAADFETGVKYHFKETKAPAGYILGDNPVEFDLTVTPQFDGNGELTNVGYKIESTAHTNFLDLGTPKVGADQTLTTASVDGNATTVFTGGIVRIENTTDLKDFAKTGGQITAYIVTAAALAIAGAFVAAKARRNRAQD